MGYYTRFKLTLPQVNVIVLPEVVDIISRRISEISRYYIEIDQDTQEIKWYDHDDDMKQLSKQYPNVLFLLSGVGEESLDLWQTYYQNGKKQVCEAKIKFESYDERKMQ